MVADGIVSFTGTRHTTVLGTRERRAAPDTYHKLEADLASFRPAAGATTEVPCGAEISDMPTYTITWTSLDGQKGPVRSEEHTSELQSLMRISYAVFCLKKKNKKTNQKSNTTARAHYTILHNQSTQHRAHTYKSPQHKTT